MDSNSWPLTWLLMFFTSAGRTSSVGSKENALITVESPTKQTISFSEENWYLNQFFSIKILLHFTHIGDKIPHFIFNEL